MIISLSGKKRAGKDTIANFMEIDRVGVKDTHAINRVSFAKKLKDTCAKVFDLEKAYMHDLKEVIWNKPQPFEVEHQLLIKKEYGIKDYTKKQLSRSFASGREMLQYIGTDFLRGIQDDIHLKSVHLDPNKLNIVTDTRFENEREYLKDWAKEHNVPFLDIYVIRQQSAEDIASQHASEQLTPEENTIVIHNLGTLDDLREMVYSVLNTHIQTTKETNEKV